MSEPNAAPEETDATAAFRRIGGFSVQALPGTEPSPATRELAYAWFLAGWREAKHGDVSPE